MYEFTSFPLGAFALTVFAIAIVVVVFVFLMLPVSDKLGIIAVPFAAIGLMGAIAGGPAVSQALWAEDVVTDNPATASHLLDVESSKNNLLMDFNVDSDSLENLIAKEINASKVSVDDLDETKGLLSGHNSFTKKAAAGKLISFTAIKDGSSVMGTFYYKDDSMVIIVNSEVENVDEIVVPLD